jgi:hypothetical protein
MHSCGIALTRFAPSRQSTAKHRLATESHREVWLWICRDTLGNGIELKSNAKAVQIWALRCNGMATTGSAGQSAVMVQKRVVWLRHRKELIRRGIARRSDGRDMQRFVEAWQGDGTHGAGIAYLATHRQSSAKNSIGMALFGKVQAWHDVE